MPLNSANNRPIASGSRIVLIIVSILCLLMNNRNDKLVCQSCILYLGTDSRGANIPCPPLYLGQGIAL